MTEPAETCPIEAAADYLDAQERELLSVARELFALMDELEALRSARSGQKPSSPAAFKALLDLRRDLRSRWGPLATMHRLNGESRGVAVLDTMLRVGMEPVASAIGGDVSEIHREYLINGRIRVDRATIHEDGRITLIEAKDGATPREVVHGIGQALHYKAVLERTSSFPRIDAALAVLQDHDQDIARACALAGVIYLPLGGLSWMRMVSKLLSVILIPEGDQ